MGSQVHEGNEQAIAYANGTNAGSSAKAVSTGERPSNLELLRETEIGRAFVSRWKIVNFLFIKSGACTALLQAVGTNGQMRI